MERTVGRLRLLAQGLLPSASPTGGAPACVEDVVRRLGMVQAQDLRQAFWAVGVRLPGSSEADLRAAFDAGRIVRTWGARGTLMLLAPERVRPLLSLTAPRMMAQMASRRRELGIDDGVVATAVQVARPLCAVPPEARPPEARSQEARQLASGPTPAVPGHRAPDRTGPRAARPGATRAELLAAFEEAGLRTDGQRGIHTLMAVCLAGHLVQGPMADDGRTAGQRFVLAEHWLPAGDLAGPGDPAGPRVLDRIAVDYFRGHGPATERDLAWWLGLPLTPVRAAVERLTQPAPGEPGLVGRERAGSEERYWMAAETAERWDDPPGARSVLALPGFDEFLLGYADRSAVLDPAHAQRVVPGSNGVFRRTLVVGGSVAGCWEPPARGGRDEPRAEHFEPPPGPRTRAGWAARMREYQRFVGR
ncbi:crosslink repair DNA glycosylase YcaQ family protein [Zhihengliuella alba]|uniref:Crosslink repair DNA glycosylase YcaQ family protein n=1 Tax=Zhihengliuella alba TaxID=547018 RepID=A0ABP7D3L5_9MICC